MTAASAPAGASCSPSRGPGSPCSAPRPRSPTTRSSTATTPPWRSACSGSGPIWSGTSRRWTDLAGGDGVSPRSLLPRWLRPALWLLVLVAASRWWCGVRAGSAPLAVEPLPVEVKAVETTRNLGRLYRRAGDRAHAAEALRRRPGPG